jgi:hypothetical protein
MLQEKALERTLSGTGTAVDFSGTWINELGSKAYLTQNNNTLSGTYESTVSGGGGTTTGELLGYVNGDLIVFIVHWDSFQAITSWVGQLNPTASAFTLNMLWQMTQQVTPGDEWASINAGADTFIRQ